MGPGLTASAIWVFALIATLGLTNPAQAREVLLQHPSEKPGHVPEVKTLLSDLTVEAPRTYRHMVVFPIRYGGRQAPGEWECMDAALEAGRLKVVEKEQASVPEIVVENIGDRSVFLMSGEIVKGGKQTRVIRQDTIVEPKQKVLVPVFCVERNRWHGEAKFQSSPNLAPSSIKGAIQLGAGQGEVWRRVEEQSMLLRAASPTGSLDEVLRSEHVQDEYRKLHRGLGRFSPPDTIGIAVADAASGKVVGLELFGRRDLFEHLQDKLIEGYATDFIFGRGEKGGDGPAREVVSKHTVIAFIRAALDGTSRYENTPGSGRGIDLTGQKIRGKGVAVGEMAIHVSMQTPRPEAAKPIVDERPLSLPSPEVR